MAGFRIDSRTIKRAKYALHCGHLVPLVSSNVEIRSVLKWQFYKNFMKNDLPKS